MKPCTYTLNTAYSHVPLMCRRCEARKCVPGLAAENYPNGFRKPNGEVWPSYGATPRSAYILTAPLLRASSLLVSQQCVWWSVAAKGGHTALMQCLTVWLCCSILQACFAAVHIYGVCSPDTCCLDVLLLYHGRGVEGHLRSPQAEAARRPR